MKFKRHRVSKVILIGLLVISLPFGIFYLISTVYLMQGDRWLAEGQIEEAINAYETVVSFNGSSARAYFKMGLGLQQQKAYSRAAAAYDRAWAIDPNFRADAHYSADLIALGDILIKKGNYPAGITAYQKAIDLDQFAPEAYLKLGQALNREKRPTEAVTVLTKAVDLNYHSAPAYFALGEAYRGQSLWFQASKAYEKALEINGKDVKIHEQLGRVLKEQGQLDSAIEIYSQGLAIDPDNAQLYNLKGEALLANNEVKKALIAYERARQINPKDASIYKNICFAQLKDRQFREVVKSCEKSLKLDPSSPDVRFVLEEVKRGLAVRDNPKVLTMGEVIPSSFNDPLIDVKRAIVKILVMSDGNNSFGTGWLVRREGSKGYIVTNRHVITNSENKTNPKYRVYAEFYSTPGPGGIRKRLRAKILHATEADDWLDLGVIEVDKLPADIKPLSFSSLPVGPAMPVKVIGNPANQPNWSLVKGEVNQNTDKEIMLAMMMVSGHSGSPVLDSRNGVIGVVSRAGLFCGPPPAPEPLEVSLKLGCGVAIPLAPVKDRLKSWGVIK
ncbi:MAG: Cell division coordinator CpoB [Chroococcopsis gigantea SAG 12.99]|jgi:tetratricopeptide (TPR) repeat protein|nr:Cell division coordinator CpoB [Chroococcopsis gigantea SAG 12.99]